jgi:hypothetical protein
MNIRNAVESCNTWNFYTDFIHRYLHIVARAKMIPTPAKCCCFIKLRTGTFIIGLIELVSADFTDLVYFYSKLDKINDEYFLILLLVSTNEKVLETK